MGFYVGMLHPLSTPPQLLALLALGLMLGQQFPRDFLACWIVFATCCFAGMVLGQTVGMQGTEDAWLLGICAIAASLAALLPNGLFLPWLVLAGGGGLLVGVVSTPDPGNWRPTLITLAGSFVGANLALLFSTGGVGWLTEQFSQHWVRIGLRIIAAWIAAISFLMLALVVAGAPDTNQISPSEDAQSMILKCPHAHQSGPHATPMIVAHTCSAPPKADVLMVASAHIANVRNVHVADSPSRLA